MITSTPYWESVPGWFDFQDVYLSLVDRARHDDTIVEVGTFLGRSACFMLEQIARSGKCLHFYVVDFFSISHPYGDGGIPPGEDPVAWKARMGGDGFFNSVKTNLSQSPAARQLTAMIQGCSWESASMFRDRSCIGAFIDADHQYMAVRKDVEAWWPKIVEGGYSLDMITSRTKECAAPWESSPKRTVSVLAWATTAGMIKR